MDNKYKWLDKYDILHPDHAHDLETRAAVNEFGPDRMDRKTAEQEAHASYVREQVLQSAAHHLKGLKVAEAAGDQDAAKKHYAMYQLGLQHLGMNEIDVPDKGVKEKSEDVRLYKFKPHRGDAFVLANAKKEDPQAE